MTTLTDLTDCEPEILELVMEGKTNRAIAREIYISEKTVGFHLQHLHIKIGVRTRLMAGAWAIPQGFAVKAREIPS